MSSTRIAFIGAGGIAGRHLGVLRSFEDVEIAGFADVNPAAAEARAGEFGGSAHADPAAMLDAVRPDAVYICVPPFAHGAAERAALERGLPFFVEKPLGTDYEAAAAIAAGVERAGLVTAVGYHWRYMTTVDEARRLLADTPARLVSGYWLDSTPPPAWWWRQSSSGGQMVEQTTHILDLARHLVGEVEEVFALGSHTERPDFPGLDVATASTVSLRFENGAVGSVSSTCLLGWHHRVGLHLFGDRLAIEIAEHDIMVDVGQGRPVHGQEGDPVWREDRDFVDAVQGKDNRIRVPYAEALATHRLTMAMTRSMRERRAVRLAEMTTPARKAS